MKTLNILITCAASLPLFSSCQRCDKFENNAYETAFIDFQLLDVWTERNLLGLYGRYRSDTVKIYDSTGKALFPGPVEPDGRIGFFPLEGSGRSFAYGVEINRFYYLYLSKADQDTFHLTFKLRKNDCGYAEFEHYRLLFNGREVTNGSGLTFPYLTLKKP